MRLFLAFCLSLQLISAPVLAEVGEKGEFAPNSHLLNLMAKHEAESFYKLVQESLKGMEAKGVEEFVKQSGLKLSKSDMSTLKTLIEKSSVIKFKETSAGTWQVSQSNLTIQFALNDLYEGQFLINGKKFVFKDILLSQLEKELLLFEAPVKTSLYLKIFNNTFGIENAHSLPVLLVFAVVGAAIAAYVIYQLKNKPEQAVKKLQEMKAKLDQDVNACESAKSDEQSYSRTFQMASSIGERSTLNSFTSPSNVLELAIQKQISTGTKNNDDCYRGMHEAGKKIKIDVPLVTASQHEHMELIGGGTKFVSKTDVRGALYNLCQSYNKMSSCMSNFIEAHVDDSDVTDFKDSAENNHYRYKRKANKATRQ